jgi:hypothetical protein
MRNSYKILAGKTKRKWSLEMRTLYRRMIILNRDVREI